MFLAEDFDAEQPDRIVLDAASTACIDGKHIGVSIDCLDAPVTSPGDGELFASASKANQVAFFIVVGDRALRTGDISANQNRVFLPARIDVTTGYRLGSFYSVLAARRLRGSLRGPAGRTHARRGILRLSVCGDVRCRQLREYRRGVQESRATPRLDLWRRASLLRGARDRAGGGWYRAGRRAFRPAASDRWAGPLRLHDAGAGRPRRRFAPRFARVLCGGAG